MWWIHPFFTLIFHYSMEYVHTTLIHRQTTHRLQCHQAGEFSSRIQKLASQGSTADRELMGPKLWRS